MQADLEGHDKQGPEKKKKERKHRETVSLHLSNSKISLSLLTPFSTSVFFFFFNDNAREFVITDGKSKGKN